MKKQFFSIKENLKYKLTGVYFAWSLCKAFSLSVIVLGMWKIHATHSFLTTLSLNVNEHQTLWMECKTF